MYRSILKCLHPAILLLALFLTIGQTAVGQTEPVVNDLEQQKFTFQRELEIRKLNLEIYKAILTAASIALPLIIGLYSINKQIKSAFKVKEVEARNSFELKAADLLLNSKTPGQLHAKAKTLMKLFPKAPLPADFPDSVKSFNPDEFTGPSIEWKLELFKTLIAHPDKRENIINTWKQFFPSDKWIDRLTEVSAAPAPLEKPSSSSKPQTGEPQSGGRTE